MEKNFASLMVELLEEQSSLIKKQIDKIKSFHGEEHATTSAGAAAANGANGAKPTKKVKVVKDKNRPKRGPSGYLVFVSENSPKVKAANPNISQTELMVLVAKNWQALDAAAKGRYNTAADKLKLAQDEKIKEYDLEHGKPAAAAATEKPVKSSSSTAASDTKKPTKKPAAAAPAATAAAPIAPPVASPVVTSAAAAEPGTEGEKKKKKKHSRDEEPAAAADLGDATPGAHDEKKKKVSVLLLSCGQ